MFIGLIMIYPDRFLFFQYFFSELGAPCTKNGSINTLGRVVFSTNMIVGALGTLSFIPVIVKLFPHSSDPVYHVLRYIYYGFIILLSIGMVFVALPYTTFWILHMIGGFICISAMWSAWCLFILFNTPWKLWLRLAVLIILNLFCMFILVSLILKWHMEFLQKPGQGLISFIVVIWPYIYYVQMKKSVGS